MVQLDLHGRPALRVWWGQLKCNARTAHIPSRNCVHVGRCFPCVGCLLWLPRNATESEPVPDLKSLIRTIPDYPKKGIMFRDVTTLLGDAAGIQGGD